MQNPKTLFKPLIPLTVSKPFFSHISWNRFICNALILGLQIVLIDLILHKRKAYRHVLYNVLNRNTVDAEVRFSIFLGFSFLPGFVCISMNGVQVTRFMCKIANQGLCVWTEKEVIRFKVKLSSEHSSSNDFMGPLGLFGFTLKCRWSRYFGGIANNSSVHLGWHGKQNYIVQ